MRSVKQCLRGALFEAGFQVEDVNCVDVGIMGSRLYLQRIYEKDSDLDLYAYNCTKSMASSYLEILHRLAEKMKARNIAVKTPSKKQPQVAEGKRTLQWTSRMRHPLCTDAEAERSSRPKHAKANRSQQWLETDTSLLLADNDTVNAAVRATMGCT